MSLEIEKKYLIEENGKAFTNDEFYKIFDSIDDLRKYSKENGWFVLQGYFPENLLKKTKLSSLCKKQGIEAKIDFNPKEARVRYYKGNHFFTVKGEGTLSRQEVETEIPETLFKKLLDNYTEGRRVAKTRTEIPYKNHIIEFDVYDDRSLITAEIEFKSESLANQFLSIGKDLTGNQNYKNKNLAK